MSFQGDVAGIGLGELLQGLARGGKDGVLTLYGDKMAACMGLCGGLIYLLESPEEEDEEWQIRATRAWMHDPNPDYAYEREEIIARAARLETIFSLLEAPNLHFRFEPGNLPQPRRQSLRGRAGAGLEGFDPDEPWGTGMAVEYLLLEHARIQDEGGPSTNHPEEYDVPCLIEGIEHPPEFIQFLEHCDDCSTVQEIADRLGWPVRQARGIASHLVETGVARLAAPGELLDLARIELENGRGDRGTSLFGAWLGAAAPGPPLRGEAERVYAMWEDGLFVPLLERLPQDKSRAIVRKLDSIDPDLERQIARWAALAGLPQASPIARMRLAVLRARQPLELNPGIENELLRIVRGFLNSGLSNRAQAVLHVVAGLAPEDLKVRVEVGTKYLESGRVGVGAEWMVEAAQELTAQGSLDEAIQVLHSLLQSAPNHRVANGMLLETRERIKRKSKRRWHIAGAAAAVMILAGAGIVRFQVQLDREAKLVAVTDMIAMPRQALLLLDETFSGDDSDRVTALRAALMKRRDELDQQLATSWTENYERLVQDIADGDPLAAFEASYELPDPPDVGLRFRQSWGRQRDLYTLLANRMEDDAVRLDVSLRGSQEELDAEQRLLEQIRAVANRARSVTRTPDVEAFSARVDDLVVSIDRRRKERAIERELQEVRALESRQDELLSAARFHAATGELESSLDTYSELMELDNDAEIAALLSDEVALVELQHAALQRALDDAKAGRHEEAIQHLERAAMEPGLYPLPFRVDSRPQGARVRLSDGSEHFTPFALEAPAGSLLRFEFVLPGTEGARIEMDRPKDLFASLHRKPERLWVNDTVVEAIPVPLGADHILCDRDGMVRRLDPQGEVVWSIELPTLGGIARTPLFLPSRPGHLLLLSEDGMAWTLEAESGELEGPWTHEFPPVEGLVPLRTSVAALFDDGTVAIWEYGAVPRKEVARSLLDQQGRFEDEYGERYDHAVALHRGAAREPELGNPWNQWRIEVLDDHYLVRRGGRQPMNFTIAREGRWQYVSWEEPNALAPEGRLWIADEGGLGSYLP